jgi:DNA polymerase-3 subunit alpha
MASDYFPVHAHSEYSTLDGMNSVEQMVETVLKLNQPALALTDHGTMAGVLRLYKECKKHDITAFPGEEIYLVTDATDKEAREKRYHLGLLALTEKGFRGLVALSSRSHSRERFHRRPLIDFNDLKEFGSAYGPDVAVTTGCYFGLPVQTLINDGPGAAARVVKMIASWFPNTFVELQNHGIEQDGQSDKAIFNQMYLLSQKLGLPVVLGQDSHYCESFQQPVHDLMKDICYFGDSDDNRFPGGPYHMASTKWLKRTVDPLLWSHVEDGHGALLDLNRLKLPALDKYQFHMPSMARNADRVLSDEVMKIAGEMGVSPAYYKAINKELKTVTEMGFANYFLMTLELIKWCQAEGIFVDARGSANGSMVCYIIGITTVDPILWKTPFDRFLSKERQKPPDIDIDIEHARRGEVIEHLRTMFPSMVNIGTYSKIGIQETEDGEDKGSIYVQYAAAMRKKTGGYGGIAPEHRPLLEALADTPVRRSLGSHAGGYVIPGDQLAIGDYLATGLIASSGTVVTQAVMEDVEEAGYVKLDVLGLRQLTTFRLIMELIGKDPMVEGMGWIPNDDQKALAVLRSGIVGNGVFQFEGWSTAKGAHEMRVATTKEAIDCIAIYRPAVMAGGQQARYLRARAKNAPETTLGASGNGSLAPLVADTWGVPIFQDQVIDIMRTVGLGFDDWNAILKAVKASNDKITDYALGTFNRVHPIFVACAIANAGMTAKEAEYAWSEVMGFADYGFNKAHATNYGLRGYRMAYLKAHYPTQFMAATLSVWTGSDKEPKYIKECHRMKLVIHRADVNTSDVLWTMDSPGHLRKGLLSVSGIGQAAAQCIVEEREDNGKYKTLEDMIERLPPRPITGGKEYAKTGELKGTYQKLLEGRCLTSVGAVPEC